MSKISDMLKKNRTVNIDGVEVEVEPKEQTEAQRMNAKLVKYLVAATAVVAAVAVVAKITSTDETENIETEDV